jgi:hypothetical protein
MTEKHRTFSSRAFSSLVGQWLYEWAILCNLSVNFVATDFFEETSLIPVALWINATKARC